MTEGQYIYQSQLLQTDIAVLCDARIKIPHLYLRTGRKALRWIKDVVVSDTPVNITVPLLSGITTPHT